MKQAVYYQTDERLQADFDDYCKRLKVTRSFAFRSLMELALSEDLLHYESRQDPNWGKSHWSK